MFFTKKYEKITIHNSALNCKLTLITKHTKEQFDSIKDYEYKQYNFNVTSAIYNIHYICDKSDEKKYETLANRYPQLKPYYKKTNVDRVCIYITLDIPFLLNSLFHFSYITDVCNFKLTLLAITFNIEITNKNDLKIFASKNHVISDKVYKINSEYCTICIYNERKNIINATGITSIDNAIMLRSIIESLK